MEMAAGCVGWLLACAAGGVAAFMAYWLERPWRALLGLIPLLLIDYFVLESLSAFGS